MVDNHVGYSAQPLALEGADHGAQLLLVAERARVVVKPVEVVVSHGVARAAVAALRYPYQFEKLRQLVGLTLEVGPLCV